MKLRKKNNQTSYNKSSFSQLFRNVSNLTIIIMHPIRMTYLATSYCCAVASVSADTCWPGVELDVGVFGCVMTASLFSPEALLPAGV